MGYGIDDLALYPLRHLNDDRAAMRFARTFFSLGVTEGVFDPLRGGPTGGERAIMATTPDLTMVGMITWWQPHRNKPFSWIDLIYVDRAWRRQGVGARLLAAAIADHPAGKSYRLQLGTFVSNKTMIGLATKAGFTDYSRTLERKIA